MTLIDKLRFHNILTKAGLPEAPSIEFADALDETFEEQVSPLATRTEMNQAIANAVLEIKQDNAEREARQNHRLLIIAMGIIAVNLAIVSAATGIIIAFT